MWSVDHGSLTATYPWQPDQQQLGHRHYIRKQNGTIHLKFDFLKSVLIICSSIYTEIVTTRSLNHVVILNVSKDYEV